MTCTGLRRSLGRQRLLERIDLTVRPGARLLLVSRPEAAASLLLGILAGLVRPQAGRMEMAGLSRRDDSAAGWARRVAYLGPEAGIHPWLSPREALDLAARLAGLGRTLRRHVIEAAAERYRLGGVLDRPLRRLGPSVRERTALAAALLTEPEVVLLDEPLRAVDPEERARLLRIPGRRRTVLLASRFPASEAGLVNEVAYLRDGRVVLHVPVTALERRGLDLSARGIEGLADAIGGSPAGGGR